MANGKLININNQMNYVTENAVINTVSTATSAIITPKWNSFDTYSNSLTSLQITLPNPPEVFSSFTKGSNVSSCTYSITAFHVLGSSSWSYSLSASIAAPPSGTTYYLNISSTDGTNSQNRLDVSNFSGSTSASFEAGTQQTQFNVRLSVTVTNGGSTSTTNYFNSTSFDSFNLLSAVYTITFVAGSNFSLSVTPPSGYTIKGLENITFTSGVKYELSFKTLNDKVISVFVNTI